MSTACPEWIWVEVVDVVEHLTGRPLAVVGMIRADGGDVMFASTIFGSPEEGAGYIVSPHSATRINSALSKGIRNM